MKKKKKKQLLKTKGRRDNLAMNNNCTVSQLSKLEKFFKAWVMKTRGHSGEIKW